MPTAAVNRILRSCIGWYRRWCLDQGGVQKINHVASEVLVHIIIPPHGTTGYSR